MDEIGKHHPGARIKSLREALGWDMTTLAARAGVSLPTISRLESQAGWGRPATHESLAKALGVPLYQLYFDGPDLVPVVGELGLHDGQLVMSDPGFLLDEVPRWGYADTTPDQRLFVENVGPGCYAARVTATGRLGGRDAREGDVVVFKPLRLPLEPQDGDLVHVVRMSETEVPIASEFRVYRVVPEGPVLVRTWTIAAGVTDGDEPGLTWRVRGVAIGMWRNLSRSG